MQRFAATNVDPRKPRRGGEGDTMTHACQSAFTLKAMLLEAAGRLALAANYPSRDLSDRIEELKRSLDEDDVVSARTEQEVVSLYVQAELAERSARGSSRSH
jgi:hypothetical protein